MALVKCKECGNEVSTKAQSCPKCGAVMKSSGGSVGGFFSGVAKLGCLVFLGIGCLCIYFCMHAVGQVAETIHNAPSPSPTAPSSGEPSFIDRLNAATDARNKAVELHNQIMDKLKVKWDWEKVAGGAIMHANFTVTNNSAYDVKDIVEEAIHSGPSGTVIDKNKRTIYQLFPAGETVEVKDFDMGFIHEQVASSECSTVDFTIVGPSTKKKAEVPPAATAPTPVAPEPAAAPSAPAKSP